VRIVIDATPLALPPTGIGTYLRETISACGRTPRGHEIVALSMGGRSETAGLANNLDSPPGVVRVHRRVRGSFVLRRLVNAAPIPLLEPIAGRADAFVGSEWLHPRQRAGVRGAIVYDLVPLRFPEWTTPETAALHGRKLADVRRSDVVVCISEATAADVREHLGIEASRVTVARPGVGDRFRDAVPAPPAALAGRPYVASLCTHEPRKNLVTLVEGFARLREQHPDLALVLVGSAGWDGGAAAGAVARLGLAADVFITGYLDDAVVPGVLAGARAFCWPALFEGFGIPVVEAQAAGVPVACSDDPSLDEAAGDAALRFAPRDPDELVAALARLIEDEALRADLQARGRAHAATLTWDATATGLLTSLEAAA
jgi:glycosyltransferase involved in cell wall biosynthesis